ncbi:T9SS type A sorting domain-containing protein [Salegentibacter sp. HM20]
MKQYYLLSFILVLFLFAAAPNAVAQDSSRPGTQKEIPIDGLSIYPNPVTDGKVYITSSRNLEKEIEIYNVLGKPVQKLRLRGRELDVSALEAGIYILRISEDKANATRKLVVR